jgi:hypothetical protein
MQTEEAEDRLEREWKMDFDAIKVVVAGILNDGGIQYKCGEDEQQATDRSIPEHLAVVFHMSDGRQIKITQPCVRQTRHGQVTVDGLIRTGFTELAFNRHTIDDVFKKALGEFVKRAGPQRRRPEEERDEAIIASVEAEGEAIGALVNKVLHRGLIVAGADASKTATIFLLKNALLRCVKESTQWR